MSEEKMIEMHRKHNEEYRKYKETHEEIKKLDLFSKGFRFKDLEKIDIGLKQLDEIKKIIRRKSLLNKVVVIEKILEG